MSRRMIAVFLAIVVLPLLAVGWLGMSFAREEKTALRARLREAAESTLRGYARQIGAQVAKGRPDLSRVEPTLEPEALRELSSNWPLVRQLFVVDGDTGELIFPSPLDDLTRAEEEFLRRTRDLWSSGLFTGPAASVSQEAQDAAGRWHVWYYGQGMNVIWWEPMGDRSVGVEVDAISLLARVIAVLPDSDAQAPNPPHSRIRLLDSNGRVLYQWGGHEPAEGEPPLAQLDLAPPLSAWKLEYLGGVAQASLAASLVPWLLPLVVGVALLAVYFYRESAREMREASQRVSFVNQVSHELKTPLTNIRMYAELLEDELADEARPRGFASIIASESQRLARLILNLLSFNKSQRNELSIRPEPGVVDEAVRRTLARFAPAFDAAGIEVEADLDAALPAVFDADVLEQVLGNLLNNVEKYAAKGGHARMASRQEDEKVTVTLADDGPGIPPAEAERIFQPFYRIGNSLTEGVTGTGIGLSIARELARTHGGDLRLLGTPRGACFELTLRCPLQSEDE